MMILPLPIRHFINKYLKEVKNGISAIARGAIAAGYSAAAENQGLQENLQKILDSRSAELDRTFKVRLDRMIETSTRMPR